MPFPTSPPGFQQTDERDRDQQGPERSLIRAGQDGARQAEPRFLWIQYYYDLYRAFHDLPSPCLFEPACIIDSLGAARRTTWAAHAEEKIKRKCRHAGHIVHGIGQDQKCSKKRVRDTMDGRRPLLVSPSRCAKRRRSPPPCPCNVTRPLGVSPTLTCRLMLVTGLGSALYPGLRVFTVSCGDRDVILPAEGFMQ